MNIGEVLTELSEEFPQVTTSKIRFLEDKGLISPQRTRAGYRKYDAHDVERLRFVLALQRDQYLPLKVIKDYLDAIDRGEHPDSLPGSVKISPRLLSNQDAAALHAKARKLGFNELVAESGASATLVRELMNFGLIPSNSDVFGESALLIAKAAAGLAAHGIEPRHLRPFKAAAEREAGLIERATIPLSSRKDTSAKAHAADTAKNLASLCLNLHSALVSEQLARIDT
ncbi:MerR family transcriptional regulator [Haematomicrobium sanguinis]|uniref:transcriptional regulator FtsR n=1 Tax=Haematomicrobium sanguinis TaxID=479106 RepID=UPI00047D6B19|nr:MerR family transcriptional regulator [Haematomicrobium sanguinis]